MNIRKVGAELIHAEGRADMTKQIEAFRNFEKAPKKGTNFYITLHNTANQNSI